MIYRRTDETDNNIAISAVEGRVLVSIGEPRNGVNYQAASWWATREDAQAILDAHDQLDAWKRTPPEPEPGAYLIGGVLCVRAENPIPSNAGWCWQDAAGYWNWLPWDKLWAKFGGPDVDIVPLVAKPEPYNDHAVDEHALANWERELLDKQARVVEAERAVVTAAKAWRQRMEGPISHGQLAGSTPQTRALVAAIDALSAADRAEAGE